MINVEIKERPVSIPIKYNAYYKLFLLIAIIKYCANGGKASLDLIHIVFWSLRNEKNFEVLLNLSKQKRKTLVPWSFEIGIDKVLSLGLVNNYLDRIKIGDSLEIRITEDGSRIIEQINQFDLFKEEILKIKSLGKIPKSRLSAANKNWSLL